MKHSKFILSPIIKNLSDAINASHAIADEINAYPLYEYVMQSIFLKMTGAQEQKLKCICWDIATHDYEYRYHKYKDGIGECSSYPDKKSIFQEIIKELKKLNSSIDLASLLVKADLIKESKDEVEKIYSNSIFVNCNYRDFLFFKSDTKFISVNQCLNYNNNTGSLSLFEETLIKDFETVVYSHRNRCAHNTMSYQENLPTLKSLSDESFKYQNYLFRFYLINFLDKIYMKLYKKYLDELQNYIL